MPESPKKQKWHHPSEVMKLYTAKRKKKALQSRINGSVRTPASTSDKNAALEQIASAVKRKNPFAIVSENKREKRDEIVPDESSDTTLFKLLENSPAAATPPIPLTSFENILKQVDENEIVVVKGQDELRAPIDWMLKSKMRLWSIQQFPWNQKLKISEEASGTTGFVRCLDTSSTTTLDTAPNAKFHQCCLYWQQPSFPWISLFPRTSGKVSESGSSIATNAKIRSSLQAAWTDSLRSLYQLIRTKQCPYFYVCSNTFTALFRAAGICGFSEVHVIITPTTRGFRHLLRQEEIDFTMPLKKKRTSDQGYDTLDSTESETVDETGIAEDEEEQPDDEWLESMGINASDIKQIKYTQAKINHKAECEVDNSDQSLVLVEGVEVHSLYNFLINCKSTISPTGPLAGIPPTLLAPVAFNGATLNSLKIRENKMCADNQNYYSLELSGPILPSTIHNLFSINPTDRSVSATFTNVMPTAPFNKITKEKSSNFEKSKRNSIFDKENLSDCGLTTGTLELFCSSDTHVTNIECLKYNSENKTYSWT